MSEKSTTLVYFVGGFTENSREQGGLETIPILGNLMDLGSLGAYGNQWLREAEQIRLIGDHGAGIVDEGWDILAEFVLQEDALTAKFDLESENNKVKVFELAEKPNQLRMNRLMRFIRPIGGVYIYIAIALCFSPLLQLLSTCLCKLTNNQSILCPRFSPQELWQHLRKL
jgi:hypothetical protein